MYTRGDCNVTQYMCRQKKLFLTKPKVYIVRINKQRIVSILSFLDPSDSEIGRATHSVMENK